MNTIKDFLANPDEVMNILYPKLRGNAIKYMRKNYTLNANEEIDVFHDSLIILWKNVSENRIQDHSMTVNTYLIAIIKKKIYEFLRTNKKHRSNNLDNKFIKIIMEDDSDLVDLKNNRIKIVLKYLNLLKDPCKTLLKLFYLEGKSYEEICLIMNYKNTDTAKNKKYKCLKRLRNLINNT